MLIIALSARVKYHRSSKLVRFDVWDFDLLFRVRRYLLLFVLVLRISCYLSFVLFLVLNPNPLLSCLHLTPMVGGIFFREHLRSLVSRSHSHRQKRSLNSVKHRDLRTKLTRLAP